MPIYTISTYITSKQTYAGKIQAYNTLIEALEMRLLEVMESPEISIDEYSMDDGQMKVRTKYRSIVELEKGIKALEQSLQRYINRHNGRVVVLRDARTL